MLMILKSSAYNATDPGILFNPHLGDTVNNGYVPPGGMCLRSLLAPRVRSCSVFLF